MSSRFLLAAALLAVACASDPAPPTARAPLRDDLGVNVHAPSGSHADLLLDRAAAAGFGWIRVDVNWFEVERRPGRYDWRLHDGLVRAARRRGLSVLGVLAYTPAWATAGEERRGVPRDAAAWGRFCEQAASRYRGEVAAWELWNEPNNDRFWAGTPQEYWQRVLIPGAAGVRRGDPGALVVGPALAHLRSGRWSQWLGHTLRRHGDLFDVVSHHAYESDPGRLASRLARARQVLAEVGMEGHPFWLTETGWQGGRGREAGQAADYRRFLEGWARGDSALGFVDKVFFYELQDAAGADPWGLLRVDGRPKEAYGTVQELARTLPRLPSTAASADGTALAPRPTGGER